MSDFIRRHKRILYILGLVFLSALFVVLGKKSIKTDKIENRVYSIHAHNDKESDSIYYQKLVKGDRVSQTFTPDTKVDGVSFEFHRGQDSKLSGRTYMTITDKKAELSCMRMHMITMHFRWIHLSILSCMTLI